jgi:cytochrome P450
VTRINHIFISVQVSGATLKQEVEEMLPLNNEQTWNRKIYLECILWLFSLSLGCVDAVKVHAKHLVNHRNYNSRITSPNTHSSPNAHPENMPGWLESFDWSKYGLSLALAICVWKIFQHFQLQAKLDRSGAPIIRNTSYGRSWPCLGQALNFVRYRPWDLLNAWHAQYGPVIGVDLLGIGMYSVASPETIKMVLQSKIASVKKDIVNSMKPFLVILGTGIVSSENESWMKQRLKMSHPLRYDVLETIPNQTLLAIQRWMKQLDEVALDTNTTSDDAPLVAVGSALRHLTLQVISGSFLSLSPEESDQSFARLYLPIVDEANRRVWYPYRSYLFFMPFFWRFWINVYQLNQYVSHLIVTRWRARKKSSSYTRHNDILDQVLDVYANEYDKHHTKDIPSAIVRQLRDEMKTFMLAGHETSAAMMTWVFYELVRQDETLCQPLRDEASTVFDPRIDWSQASVADLPPRDKLDQLIYSEACLRESLRKYCVVPIVARRTIHDLPLELHPSVDGKDSSANDHPGTVTIPKGSSVMIHIQAVHHNPEIWPDPLNYDPTRFINHEIRPYTFLPFIAGPRNCLGQYLALLESKMVLSLISQRYQFRLPHRSMSSSSLPSTSALNPKSEWIGDPRHRFMVPVIPENELYVQVIRNKL